MGCANNKSKTEIPRNASTISQYTIGSLKTNDLSTLKEITSIKDFKVTQSDFVSEKHSKIEADYNLLLPPIGKGSFGEVRKAVHRKTNITRAIKIINRATCSREEQQKLINEVNILKTLDHPNIMNILEFYQDEKHFYIVTEFYSGGELFEKILDLKYFSEKQAAITMKQLLSAVFYCHQHKIVHRDLKPENILYETKKGGSSLKVIDFGTSKVFDPSQKMSQKFGTVSLFLWKAHYHSNFSILAILYCPRDT